jgi:hypothetical protein
MLRCGVVVARSTGLSLAEELLDQVYSTSIADALDQPAAEDFIFKGSRGEGLNYLTQFLAEFSPDPVEVLKALDNDLFMEFDRERSERELRGAIAGPLIALFGFLAWDSNPWFAVPLLLAIGLLIVNSTSAALERARVINLVRAKGIKTSTMLQAQTDARLSARGALAEWKRVQRDAERPQPDASQ